MKSVILKVIITYKEGSKRSVWKTDAGMEDARRFADDWAVKEHVSCVRIFRGRTLLQHVK